MGKFIDRTGERFGRLVVINCVGRYTGSGHAIWACICDCGKTVNVPGGSLQGKNTKSCGCLRDDLYKTGDIRRTHGRSYTREYKAWQHMVDRCYNPNCCSYRNYGGRGITICDSWHYSFEDFFGNIGFIPDGKSLDRINNNSNYEPGNWRFATPKEQANNRRDNKNNKYKNHEQ